MLNMNTNNHIIVDYIMRYRLSNDIKIRNELITKCWLSIQNYSKHFFNLYKCFDLIDYDNILFDAFIYVIENFDLDKKMKVSTYFYMTAKGKIHNKLKYIYNRRKILNTVSFNKLDNLENTQFIDYLCDTKIDIENDFILKCEYEEKIKKCRSIYKDIRGKNAKEIFKEYYFNGLRYKEISKKLNLTENNIRGVITRFNKKILQLKS